MTATHSYTIRRATSADEPFLLEMLYQSLYVENGAEPFSRDVLNQPRIARYVKGWGREGDMGFVAIDSKSLKPIGAVWSRLSSGEDKGFAYLDDATPEMGIAVLAEHRGMGVGTALVRKLLAEAVGIFPAISLSVSPNNPAKRLYEKLGFVTVDVRGGYPVMRRQLKPCRRTGPGE